MESDIKDYKQFEKKNVVRADKYRAFCTGKAEVVRVTHSRRHGETVQRRPG